ncbi:MAG: pilus assembly protein [Burkholderiaceae bacterium]
MSRPSQHPASGQGMTEYIVIVALIAVAAIGTYSLLGQTVRSQTAGLALEISGQSAQPAISEAGTTATNSQTQANQRKGLNNCELNNH